MVEEEARRAIQNLRNIRPELDDAIQKANQVVARVERFLNEEFDFSIHCCATIEKSGDETTASGAEFTSLEYARVDDEFRIVVTRSRAREGQYGIWEEEIVERTAWTDCPRGTRLKAFAKLPDLLDWISKNALEMAEKTAATARSVERLLNAVE